MIIIQVYISATSHHFFFEFVFQELRLQYISVDIGNILKGVPKKKKWQTITRDYKRNKRPRKKEIKKKCQIIRNISKKKKEGEIKSDPTNTIRVGLFFCFAQKVFGYFLGGILWLTRQSGTVAIVVMAFR